MSRPPAARPGPDRLWRPGPTKADDAAAKRQDERKRKQAEDDARTAEALAELDALAVLKFDGEAGAAVAPPR